MGPEVIIRLYTAIKYTFSTNIYPLSVVLVGGKSDIHIRDVVHFYY